MKKLRSTCERTFGPIIAELVVYVNEILGLKICQKFKSYPNSNHISIKKNYISIIIIYF